MEILPELLIRAKKHAFVSVCGLVSCPLFFLLFLPRTGGSNLLCVRSLGLRVGGGGTG